MTEVPAMKLSEFMGECSGPGVMESWGTWPSKKFSITSHKSPLGKAFCRLLVFDGISTVNLSILYLAGNPL